MKLSHPLTNIGETYHL